MSREGDRNPTADSDAGPTTDRDPGPAPVVEPGERPGAEAATGWLRSLVPGDPRAAGSEPDYRFTLANERTFLAWIRTALALAAGGLGAIALLPDLDGSEPWACCDCDCTEKLEERMEGWGRPFLEVLREGAR